ADFFETHAMGDKLLQRKFAAENQTSGFGLQIYIGTVGTEQNAFSYTDVGAAEFDSFGCGGLGKEQYSGAGTRDAKRLLDESRSTSGKDNGVGATALRGRLDGSLETCLPG